ncbi:MAG: hypothetical protein GY811_08435 [Myxococcales bacterium]|nr:hypothetical protein [Myxococcales bacterium]
MAHEFANLSAPLCLHSSIETAKVVIEPAALAWTITSSNYRIVGKILSQRNLPDWLRGRTSAGRSESSQTHHGFAAAKPWCRDCEDACQNGGREKEV